METATQIFFAYVFTLSLLAVIQSWLEYSGRSLGTKTPTPSSTMSGALAWTSISLMLYALAAWAGFVIEDGMARMPPTSIWIPMFAGALALFAAIKIREDFSDYRPPWSLAAAILAGIAAMYSFIKAM